MYSTSTEGNFHFGAVTKTLGEHKWTQAYLNLPRIYLSKII